MIIPHAFIEAVIKRDALEKREKGLSSKIIKDYKLSKARYDDDLIIIPWSMSDYGTEVMSKELEEKYGLIYLTKEGKAQDFVFCNKQFVDPDLCDWLKRCRLEEDIEIDGVISKKNDIYYDLIKTL